MDLERQSLRTQLKIIDTDIMAFKNLGLRQIERRFGKVEADAYEIPGNICIP